MSRALHRLPIVVPVHAAAVGMVAGKQEKPPLV
jgi:hypothetical protein